MPAPCRWPLRRDAAAAAAEIVLYVEKRCSARRRRWSAPSAGSAVPERRHQRHSRAAATCRSTSAPATTPRAMPRLRTCLPRSSGSRTRRGVAIEIKEIQRGPAVPCSPRLQALFAAAIERAGIAAFVAAERRRPRRRDVQRRHRRRHAVRALRQWRHQSFAARNHHGGRCRRRGAHPPRHDHRTSSDRAMTHR